MALLKPGAGFRRRSRISAFIIVSIIAALSAEPCAFAQADWVSRFLSEYSPSTRPEPTQLPAAAIPSIQGQVLPLGTGDAIRLLLQNNRDLTVSRTVPLSDYYFASTFVRPFQPRFYVTGFIDHLKTPSSNVLEGAVALIQLRHTYKAGIAQALLSGTAYNVEFEFARASTNSVFEVFNPAYTGVIRYGIQQHLLRNYGWKANSSQIRIARNNEKTSQLDFELEIINEVTLALHAYWDLVFAFEDKKVKQHALDLASRTLRDNKIMVDVGSLAAVDLVQTETEIARRNSDLVTADYTIDQLQDRMKRVISNEGDPGLRLARLDLIEPLRQPDQDALPPLPDAIRFALENRIEMRQAEYDIQNQEITVQFTKNQKLPVLDISAGYAHSGLGGTATIRSGLGTGSEIVRVIPGGPSDMFRQLFSYKYPDYTAGFTLEIPLWNTAAKADYERSLTERELAINRRDALAQRIALEVRNAYSQVEMNRAKAATGRRVYDLAREKLNAEQAKFDLGISTIRFVLEEQRSVAQAQTDEIEALVNYTKALVTFDRVTGTTLSKNKIEFETQLPRQITVRD